MNKRKGRKIAGIVLWLPGLYLLLAACGPDNTPVPSPTPAFNVADANKIDTLLRDLLAQYQLGGIPSAREYAQSRGLIDDQDRVRFGLTLTNPGAAATVTARLQQMGGEVYQSNGADLAVIVSLTKLTGYINSTNKNDFFSELASLKEVRELRVLLKPALDWTSLSSVQTLVVSPNEGVALIGADKWQAAGFKGQGIKVGIIDGGFKGYRAGLGGALPDASRVTLRSFTVDHTEGSEQHGVLVAELVHSLAPEATLFLAPIEDEIGFSQAVDWLLENKVQIIQASLGWAGLFPGDGTGRMDEQLDRARRQGVLPIVSVGNYGEAHYTAQLNAEPKGFQRFGTGPNNRQTLKLRALSNSAWVALRWDEKWTSPQTNLDLFVLDDKQQPLASSRNIQGTDSPKPPTELIPFRTTPGQTYYVQIQLIGAKPAILPRLHLFAYNATLEESSPEGSVATPGDARGVLSVGAVNWNDDKLENYSSRGPTADGRPKPELTGPSQVHTQTLGREQVFSGTSASAPQVSGSAAVVWSAAPKLTADQVALYLEQNALRPANANILRDLATGYGRIKLNGVELAQRGPNELLSALPAGPAFQDDFRAIGSGLPDNLIGYYGKLPEGLSAYFVRADENGTLNWNSYLQKSFEEFRAEFEAAPLQTDPALFYGLTFWQQGPQDYYAFLVSGDRYGLFRRNGPEWNSLIEWTRNAALNSQTGPTSRQHLSVEATFDYIRLRAGDKVLQTFAFRPTRPGGRLGFLAGLFGGGRPVVNSPGTGNASFAMFSNLSVAPLSTRN
jgi:subtilisin family serine protease